MAVMNLMAQQSASNATGTAAITANAITAVNGGDNVDVVINLDYQTANNVVGASFTLYLPDGLLLKGFTYENLEQWVVGVAETGTFYARSSANWTVDANNGNPKDIGRA